MPNRTHAYNVCCLLFKALSDIQIAVKMVQSSQESDEHPLDRQYHSLQCALQPLDSSSREYAVSLSYLIQTIKTQASHSLGLIIASLRHREMFAATSHLLFYDYFFFIHVTFLLIIF